MHYDDIIIHYGVKGMKWGVRKKISDFGHRLYYGHKEYQKKYGRNKR